MITKSPSHYDGKPIGTPTSAVSPQQAGVTTGPDQIELAEAARKARNRATKLAHRVRVKAGRRAKWESFQARDDQWWEYKQKRRRAFDMSRSIKRGRSVAWCARVHGISVDQAFQELRWWDARVERRYGRKRESLQAVDAVARAEE